MNGVVGGLVSTDDRGLALGDGVFRTLECLHGQPLLWRWQYACLARDAAKLALPLPAAALLATELAQACAGLPRAVAKITLTRGVGPRGYAMPSAATPTRIVAAHAWNGYPPHWAQDGIALDWCPLRLGLQPHLAGIKHLNRLENVLARSALPDDCQEGLLCDSDGWVVEGTMSNLFVLRDGRWLTPRLDRCGVAGALRDWVLTQLPVEEARLTPQAVQDAPLLFVCNSLAGVWPVARLGARVWRDFDPLRPLQSALAQERAPQAIENRL